MVIKALEFLIRVAVVVIITFILPFAVFTEQSIQLLAQARTLIGPTFLPLLVAGSLTMASMVRAIALGASAQAKVTAKQALMSAEICLWLGFIGTYIALQKAMFEQGGKISTQLVGEAMASTMWGAIAIVLAGSLVWLIGIISPEVHSED